MGRKILLVFSFIFLILLLVGCGNISDEKNNSEIQIPLEPDFRYFSPVRDVFEMARNVYEAELVELKENKYEYSQYATADFQGNFKIKVRIKFVYKGDLLPGEDIVEDTVLLNYPECINIGSTYLFMTGIDEDYIDADKNKLNLYYDSRVHVIEILKDGMFSLALSCSNEKDEISLYHYCGRKKYSTYYEILYDMLNLEEIGGVYGEYFTEYFTEDTYTVISLEKMYELADNVYIGDIVEIQDYGKSEILLDEYNDWEKCAVSKVKVKVLSVAKGDYVSGQIIEDIIPLNQYATEIYGNSLLCISGDDFFAYYKEMLSGEKSMEDVTSMVFP